MPYKDRNCLECELKYSPNSPSQKYCFNCREEKRREYHREYAKRPEVKVRKREYEKQYKKKYYQKPENKIRKRESDKEYRQRPKVKKRKKEYHQENKEKLNLKMKKYYQENKEKLLKQSKEDYQNNKEKYNKRSKEYNQKPESKKKRNENKKYRRKTDKNFNIKLRLSSLLRMALKNYTKTGKVISSSKYGINFKAIIKHLKPFPEDISLYHIDHKKPLCSFDFTNPKEIKKAFMPSNHQWLLAQENMIKGGRY